MSASLVGSGDVYKRQSAASSKSGNCFPQNLAQGGLRPRLAAIRETEDPVSYTHLTLPTICSV
eukprot:990242-Alexandrium_andersonii.AAC.1